MSADRGTRLVMAALVLGLIFNLAGMFGLIHPRTCLACLAPYHRGRPCDWTRADA
jgi:hypothetical protein